MNTVCTRAVGHSWQLPTSLAKESTFYLHTCRAHILGSSKKLSMLHELGLSLGKLPPITLLSDLLAIFFAKLSSRYHGAHAESEGCFTLTPKVASDPDV